MESSHRIGLIIAGVVVLGALAVAGGRTMAVRAESGGKARRPSIALVGTPSGGGRGLVVEVINGTAREGLARQVTRLLREQGVDVVYVGSTERRPDSTTVMVRRGSDLDPARPVARIIGTKRVSVETDSTRRVDLTVMLGADYRFPADRLPL